MASEFEKPGAPYSGPPIDPPPEKPPYLPNADERTWGMLAHLAGLIAMMLGGFAFLGPLIVWLIKKDQSPFVSDQAKEALNFQIAVTIALLVAGAIALATCIGIVLLPIVGIASLVFAVLAAIEANKGAYYRYPFTIRLIP
jgi:uncharacterized protein